MDQNSDQPIPQPPEESAALEALERKAADRAYPKLTLARELAVHLKTYPQSQESLAAKLHIRRPDLTQILGLLSLPEKTQTELEGKALSAWEIKKQLRSRNLKASNGNGTTGTTAGTSGTLPEQTEQGLEKTKIIAEHAESSGTMPGKNENNGGTMRNKGLDGKSAGQTRGEPGYPLIRDTIDELLKFMTFWRQELHMGQIVVRWLVYGGRIGWLRTSLRVLATGLALYGGARLVRQGGDWIQRLRAPHPYSPHSWRATVACRSLSPGERGSPSALSPVRITSHRLIVGNRMELKWMPAGKGYAYRVYWHTPDKESSWPLGPEVATPGAILDAYPAWGKGFVTVTAVAPDQSESPHSEPVAFLLKPQNRREEVEPLPPEGATPAQGSGLRAQKEASGPQPRARSAVSVQVPTELHFTLKTPDLIDIRWRAVGPGFRYNLYSSPDRELTRLRKENDKPFASNFGSWIPETGLERYWIVVTAVDALGHESAYSEAIEIVRHPEATGKKEALEDAAGGVLRKVLPW